MHKEPCVQTCAPAVCVCVCVDTGYGYLSRSRRNGRNAQIATRGQGQRTAFSKPCRPGSTHTQHTAGPNCIVQSPPGAGCVTGRAAGAGVFRGHKAQRCKVRTAHWKTRTACPRAAQYKPGAYCVAQHSAGVTACRTVRGTIACMARDGLCSGTQPSTKAPCCAVATFCWNLALLLCADAGSFSALFEESLCVCVYVVAGMTTRLSST